MLRPALSLLAFLLGAAAMTLSAPAQGPAQTFTPKDERIEDLPAGPGREETFGMCTACHGYKLVSNQGMTREKWDETLHWMTERHNMPDIQGADRDLILDYLATHYPPKAPSRAGGFKNPFAPQ
jgi:mono/diheme cytochrome c family protein